MLAIKRKAAQMIQDLTNREELMARVFLRRVRTNAQVQRVANTEPLRTWWQQRTPGDQLPRGALSLAHLSSELVPQPDDPAKTWRRASDWDPDIWTHLEKSLPVLIARGSLSMMDQWDGMHAVVSHRRVMKVPRMPRRSPCLREGCCMCSGSRMGAFATQVEQALRSFVDGHGVLSARKKNRHLLEQAEIAARFQSTDGTAR